MNSQVTYYNHYYSLNNYKMKKKLQITYTKKILKRIKKDIFYKGKLINLVFQNKINTFYKVY